MQGFDDVVLLAHFYQRLGEVWFDAPLPAPFIFLEPHPLERLDAARDEFLARAVLAGQAFANRVFHLRVLEQSSCPNQYCVSRRLCGMRQG